MTGMSKLQRTRGAFSKKRKKNVHVTGKQKTVLHKSKMKKRERDGEMRKWRGPTRQIPCKRAPCTVRPRKRSLHVAESLHRLFTAGSAKREEPCQGVEEACFARKAGTPCQNTWLKYAKRQHQVEHAENVRKGVPPAPREHVRRKNMKRLRHLQRTTNKSLNRESCLP